MWGRVGGSGGVRRLEAGRQGFVAQPCGNRRPQADGPSPVSPPRQAAHRSSLRCVSAMAALWAALRKPARPCDLGAGMLRGPPSRPCKWFRGAALYQFCRCERQRHLSGHSPRPVQASHSTAPALQGASVTCGPAQPRSALSYRGTPHPTPPWPRTLPIAVGPAPDRARSAPGAPWQLPCSSQM